MRGCPCWLAVHGHLAALLPSWLAVALLLAAARFGLGSRLSAFGDVLAIWVSVSAAFCGGLAIGTFVSAAFCGVLANRVSVSAAFCDVLAIWVSVSVAFPLRFAMF